MNTKVVCIFALVFVAIALLAGTADASAYRKPPFNGSIFGKRGNGAPADIDSRVAFSALCEVAIEACSSWMPLAQDSK